MWDWLILRYTGILNVGLANLVVKRYWMWDWLIVRYSDIECGIGLF